MAGKSFHDEMSDRMAGMGGSSDSSEPADDEGGDDAFKAAVSSFIDAVHSKDTDAAADAFKQMDSLCPKGADEEEGDGGGPGGHALLIIPHKGH